MYNKTTEDQGYYSITTLGQRKALNNGSNNLVQEFICSRYS